jgi:hypothetical protein
MDPVMQIAAGDVDKGLRNALQAATADSMLEIAQPELMVSFVLAVYKLYCTPALAV